MVDGFLVYSVFYLFRKHIQWIYRRPEKYVENKKKLQIIIYIIHI